MFPMPAAAAGGLRSEELSHWMQVSSLLQYASEGE